MRITIIDSNQEKIYSGIIKRNSSYDSSFKAKLDKAADSLDSVDSKNSLDSLNSKNNVDSLDSSNSNNPVDYLNSLNNGQQQISYESYSPVLGKVTEVPSELMPYFDEASKTYGIDKGILIAIAKRESNFRSDATSSAGARGIMQLMPETAKGLGVTNAYDPEQNIMGAARLLSSELKKYNGNLSLALAAYGAGGGSVGKYNGIPPYTETRNSITRALAYYSEGYKIKGSADVTKPDAAYLAEKLAEYKSTNGSAYDKLVTINASQKKDLIIALTNAEALLHSN